MQYLANNTLHDIVPRYYMAGAGICLSQPLTAASRSKYITVVDESSLENFHTPSSMPHNLSGDDIANLRLRSIPPYVTREYCPPSR